jgi:hypothetical protein
MLSLPAASLALGERRDGRRPRRVATAVPALLLAAIALRQLALR